MDSGMLVALAIFLLTYVLISVRNFRKFVIERYVVALFGAALMILFGVVSASEAIDSIDMDTLLLLFGMMLLVIGLEICGFFDWVSMRLVRHSHSHFQFLVLMMVVTAILSALILNDTVVLLFTPIVIKTCRLIQAHPIPYLVAEACAVNIGSLATPVGNPQNAYIATQSGIPFSDFFLTLAPLAVLSMAAAVVIIWLVFRKEFVVKNGENGNRRNGKVIDRETLLREVSARPMHRSIYFVLAVLCLVLVGFILSPEIDIPLSWIAFMGGVSVLFLLPFLNHHARPKEMVMKVDWTLLLFFIGLFVLLEGVSTSGLMDEMMLWFQSANGEGIASIAGLTTFSAILSNLISNVPAVMLLTPFIADLGSNSHWLALASSSTLAGNATILGAAANVIVVEGANAEGVEVKFFDFLKAGLPIAIVTLLMSVLWLG